MADTFRAFGYICPECGKAVMACRSSFALAASKVDVECSCGKSALQVENDGVKCHVYVPCGICGETHHAACDAKALLEGRGIGLGCSNTQQICCYIGEEDRVSGAMKELEILVAKEKQQEENPEAFLDSVIMYEVLSELKEIAARPKGITCTCGSENYTIQVRHAAVDVCCEKCGSKLRIPAATDEDLDRLCCHMKLQIKGR